MDRSELEAQLLRQPFDAELRGRYAELLLDTGEAEAALQQAELLCQQQPQAAAPQVLAARAQLAGGQRAAAVARYLQARGLPGCVADDTLERLVHQAQPTAGPSLVGQAQPTAGPAPHLQLVGGGGGGGGAEVRALAQAAQVVPDKVRFSSIVGMEALKKTIRLKIVEPFVNPGLFARFRQGSGGGILLFGPPGCGKTMIARAVANECNAEFISVGISDILNMWLGESERNLAAMFDKARASSPAVLFFDELDALAFARSKAQSSSARTVVNEFLAQLDGIGRENRGVLVLAATNMPWDVDSAMKRPGRFARQIFVPPPDAAAREAMLRVKLTGVPLAEELPYAALAARTTHYSGADIDGLIERATEQALMDNLDGHERGLRLADFDTALANMQPSTLDWLRTVRNVVKYAGDDGGWREVEQHLKSVKLL